MSVGKGLSLTVKVYYEDFIQALKETLEREEASQGEEL